MVVYIGFRNTQNPQLFFKRKVMPDRRQRKAATQVMQNLDDGTTPEGRAR